MRHKEDRQFLPSINLVEMEGNESCSENNIFFAFTIPTGCRIVDYHRHLKLNAIRGDHLFKGKCLIVMEVQKV